MLEGRNQNVHVYLLSVQIANDSRHMDQSEWGLATFQDLSKKILKLAPIILTLLCTYKFGNKRMTAKQGGPVYYKMHSIEIIGPGYGRCFQKARFSRYGGCQSLTGLFHFRRMFLALSLCKKVSLVVPPASFPLSNHHVVARKIFRWIWYPSNSCRPGSRKMDFKSCSAANFYGHDFQTRQSRRSPGV